MKLKLRRLGNSMAVLIPSITVNIKGWKAVDLIDVVFEPDVDEAERLAEMIAEKVASKLKEGY